MGVFVEFEELVSTAEWRMISVLFAELSQPFFFFAQVSAIQWNFWHIA
jgi:hypothetical protein